MCESPGENNTHGDSIPSAIFLDAGLHKLPNHINIVVF